MKIMKYALYFVYVIRLNICPCVARGHKSIGVYFFLLWMCVEGQAWCSGESYLTESPGRGFEAASPQILRGEGLPRFSPSPDPTHVGASGTGSALCPF